LAVVADYATTEARVEALTVAKYAKVA